MSLIQIAIPVGLLISCFLCYVVVRTNPQKVENRSFFLLSIIVVTWLNCIWKAFTAFDNQEAEFWIRQCCASGQFFMTGFNILRLSIVHRNDSWKSILGRARLWWIANGLIAGLCQTRFFLEAASLSMFGGVPVPTYGPGFFIYNAYFLSAFVIIVQRMVKDSLHVSGVQRTELQFTLLGFAAFCLIGGFFGVFLPFLIEGFPFVEFTPLWVIGLNVIIAYGIATRRLMGVSDILRATTAYALLAIYLVGLYFATWKSVEFLVERRFHFSFPVAHFTGALVLAFSMSPAYGRMQHFANRLRLITPSIDAPGIVRMTHQILYSVTTLPELFKGFCSIIARVIGTDHVMIFLLEKNTYVSKYMDIREDLQPFRIESDDPLVRALARSQSPVVAYGLERLRWTDEVETLRKRLMDFRAAIVIGIRSRDSLQGFMVLGTKISGRIYTVLEEDTLQLLCDRLAIAIENAQLYTQAQDNSIYHEILLDSLVSGVIAINAKEEVTVFNGEAQRITHLSLTEVLGRKFDVLPKPLLNMFQQTIEAKGSLRDQKAILYEGTDREVPIQLGSSVFKGHTGDTLGVLMVLHDLTAVKKLEMQVHYNDRLASLGTLSAGMAHEIKNPLVTIKTFTQLLKERYDDADFRENFASLVGHEVARVDALVNQLLRFSRPQKPTLNPICLHPVLEKSIRLVEHQAKQRSITLIRSFDASADLVRADPALLEQAFINIFLNAVDAIGRDGHLSVATKLIQQKGFIEDPAQSSGEWILVDITDDGGGVRPDDIPRLFDPFFSTKSSGTGLGLAVTHRIIQEHHGMIEVESVFGKGTTFHIAFSLAMEGVAA